MALVQPAALLADLEECQMCEMLLSVYVK